MQARHGRAAGVLLVVHEEHHKAAQRRDLLDCILIELVLDRHRKLRVGVLEARRRRAMAGADHAGEPVPCVAVTARNALRHGHDAEGPRVALLRDHPTGARNSPLRVQRKVCAGVGCSAVQAFIASCTFP